MRRLKGVRKHLAYEVLHRIVERSMSDDELAAAERHLARCGVCRSEREWLDRLRAEPKPFATMPPLLGSM